METGREVFQWLSAAAFIGLALTTFSLWRRQRERAEAHLAWAMALFGAAILAGVIVARVYPSSAARLFPPQAARIITPVLVVLGLYAFLLFLSDFIRFPAWARALAVAGTVVMAALSAIERPDIALVNGQITSVDVNNPMDFVFFVKALYIYLAIGFGVLAVSFGVYAVRVSQPARARMLTTSAGFLVLFVASGIVPRVLIGRPSSSVILWIILLNQAFVFASAPLLYFGFTPPQVLKRRAGRRGAVRHAA
ncbi:MAG: hypothetical protein WDA27_12685 [Actinomycetota bacterium]